MAPIKGRLTVRNRKPRAGQAPFSVTIEAHDVRVWLDSIDRVNAALQSERESLIELGKLGGKVRQRHAAPGGRIPRGNR